MATTSTPVLRRLPVGGQGPEDVAVLHNRLVTGVADGRLLSVALDGTDVAMVADTGGRPLGIEVLPDGRLVVCRRLGWLAAALDLQVPVPARVLAVDCDGQVVARIECGRGYRMVTGVREHAGSLYFGSLTEHAIAASTCDL